MLSERKDEIELVVVSGAWPRGTTGYEIAIGSALRVYAERFPLVHFFGPEGEPFDGAGEWDGRNIRWIPLPFVRGPLWLRFLRSIFLTDPAITVRFHAAANVFRGEFANIVSQSSERNRSVGIMYEDLPASCFMRDVRRDFPRIAQGVHSHNVSAKVFAGLDRQGMFHERMAWRIELAKTRRFEKRTFARADVFWAISAADAAIYRDSLGITPDGIFGISLDCERYATVECGDVNTVVYVGAADLIKGMALVNFIQKVWPSVRAEAPEARLILAGRGTERFTDTSLNINGLGFVDDDRDVLSQGLIFLNPQQIGSGIQLKSVVAMLAGKALVSTPLAVEGVEGKDGEHFVVAEPTDEMASRIVSLMRDSECARRLGQKARELAAQTYSHEHLLETAKLLLDAFVHKAGDTRPSRRTTRKPVSKHAA